jgi:hypothetical protein
LLARIAVNLFIVGWGLTEERSRKAVEELRRTSRLYPQLDHASLWHRSLPGGVLLAAVQSPQSMAEPRQYVHEDGRTTTTFDGLPMDPSGGFAAYRADQLAAHWPELIDRIEGRFCVIQLRREPVVELELISDAVGVEQLYFHEDGRSSLVSNSAGVVQRIVDATEPDPLGVSMFLAIDWVGSDRTLRRAVRVADGAQHWTWRAGDRAWTKHQFWTMAQVGRPDRPVDRELVDEVVGDVTRFCEAAAQVTGSLNAPITGGKDSRMLAAILMTAGLPAKYWTKGDAGSLDLKIGLEIAERYHLPHRVANRPTQAEDGRDPTRDIAGEWVGLAEEFVAQNDGLASLFNVGNIQGQPKAVDRIAVTLSAMCAESSREAWGQPWILGPGGSVARAKTYLPFVMMIRPTNLVSPDVFALTRQYLRDLVDRWSDAGVPLDNIPAAFYLDERCRRWAPNNPRELAQTEDKVLPFLTRQYVRSALTMRARDRAEQLLHREIIRTLVPGFDNDPPPDMPWKSPHTLPMHRRMLNEVMPRVPYPARKVLSDVRARIRPPRVGRVLWSPYDEESWLEANLPWAREIAFASDSSPLWAWIDRRTLERLLDDRTTQDERRPLQLPIFAALTMFQFEVIERSMATATATAA